MNRIYPLYKYLVERDRGVIMSLFGLACLVYLPFIGNPFIFDDLSFFGSGATSNFHWDDFNIRLRYFSYAPLSLIWQVSLDIPWAYHLFSLLIHGINLIFLFVLLAKLSKLTSNYSQGRIWFATAIFGLHPICTYAVGYAVQLSILMATMFTLAMLLSFIEGLLTQKNRWFLGSAILYFLAVFSKEHAITAPILTAGLILLFCQRREIQFNWRVILATWSGYALIGVFLILHINGVIGVAYEHDAPMLSSYQSIKPNASLHILSILTQCGLFFKYLFLWIFPNPSWMSIDMRAEFENVVSIWSVSKAVAFIVYGLFASYLLLYSKSAKLIGFALIFPLTFFLVEFSTIRIQEPFVLYRSYLWMPGFLPIILIALPPIKNKITCAIGPPIILIILIFCSWNRLWTIGDEYRLWNDAAILLDDSNASGAARIFYNRGSALQKQDKWQESIEDFKRVTKMHPQIEQAHAHLGIAYYNLGDYDSALKAYNRAIDSNPDYAYGYFGKAMALKKMHKDSEAAIAIEKACALNHTPSCAIAYYMKSKKQRTN